MKRLHLGILAAFFLALAMCVALPSCQKNDAGKTAADASAKSDADASAAKTVTVGDIITFGRYEQDDDTTNGKEPITWRILDKNDKGQYLIVSEKVIDVKRYNLKASQTPVGGYPDGDSYIVISANNNIPPVNWENSTIRSWLNGYDGSLNSLSTDYTGNNFIDAAFTAEEKAQIVSSHVPADKNPNYSTSPGNATTDKVFLLSIVEVQKYFTSDENRLADATTYVIANGAEVSELTSDSNDNVHRYAHWWLRSPGDESDYAAVVDNGGGIFMEGGIVDGILVGVRPAMWVQY